MKVGILGLGDVGKAIKKLCLQKHLIYGRDLNIDQLSGKKIDILHICIPYASKFEAIVISAIREFSPNLTIINSTVRPGTTQSVYKKTKTNLVHAPVIGTHPHLYNDLKTFTKPLGATSDKAFQLAKKHFTKLGVKVVRFDSPLETELAKILSTTYYTWNILFEKWVHQLSHTNKANFDQVYKQWNRIYNTGYKHSNPNVIRPILKHFPGPVGGHCLIPNAEILNDWLHDDYTKFILKQNKIGK